MSANELRQLGSSQLKVSPVALGCWPIAGMTSLNVNDTDSLRTIQSALACGINHLDTAFCYGANGESERLISQAIESHREQVVIATKGGVHWNEQLERKVDGSPERLTWECEESLRRLRIEQLDVIYLHAPDPQVDIQTSAAALAKLVDSNKAKSVGVSNVDFQQLKNFSDVITPTVVQLPFNMLQQSIQQEIVPWCAEHKIAIAAYWPLMKGLLGGHLRRDHQFDERDKRLTYPMYKGNEWQHNQVLVDELEAIANEAETTVAALVVAWTIAQPGITVALCGAKRSWQIEETAKAMHVDLSQETMDRIDRAIEQRFDAGISGY